MGFTKLLRNESRTTLTCVLPVLDVPTTCCQKCAGTRVQVLRLNVWHLQRGPSCELHDYLALITLKLFKIPYTETQSPHALRVYVCTTCLGHEARVASDCATTTSACTWTSMLFDFPERDRQSLSSHITWYGIISYHIISYHIISYHIISYHTISL